MLLILPCGRQLLTAYYTMAKSLGLKDFPAGTLSVRQWLQSIWASSLTFMAEEWILQFPHHESEIAQSTI